MIVTADVEAAEKPKKSRVGKSLTLQACAEEQKEQIDKKAAIHSDWLINDWR